MVVLKAVNLVVQWVAMRVSQMVQLMVVLSVVRTAALLVAV